MRMLMNRSDLTNAVGATILAAALVSVAGGAERVAAPRGERDVQYIVVELEVPAPWEWVKPYAMNEQGQIVGEGEYAGDDRAFLWDDGEMILLDVLPGHSWSIAYDINNSGVIVGWSWAYDALRRAVAWVDGEIIDLGDEIQGRAYAINDEGTIAGCTRVGEEGYHAVIGDVTGWKLDIGANWPGLSSSARGINEEGIVVGTVNIGPGNDGFCGATDAFMWDDGEVTLLWQVPPNHEAYYGPWDINQSRCVVGEKHSGYYQYCNAYTQAAWQWHAGEGELLPNPNPDAGNAVAYAMNDAGDVVGYASDDGGDYYVCATLWRDGIAYDLNDLIDPESEVHVSGAYDIDDRGRILACDFLADHCGLLLLVRPGDIDGDGVVDTEDLLTLLAAWGDCPFDCPWDFNGDGVVDDLDADILVEHWGDCPDPPAECPWDLNGDGTVNGLDLVLLAEHYGPCPFGDCPTDLDGDDDTDSADLLTLLGNWG
jgi:probable HAF family extracellular repeat protein